MRSNLQGGMAEDLEFYSGPLGAERLTISGTYTFPENATALAWFISSGSGGVVNVKLPRLARGKTFLIANAGTTGALHIQTSAGVAIVTMTPSQLGLFISNNDKWWFAIAANSGGGGVSGFRGPFPNGNIAISEDGLLLLTDGATDIAIGNGALAAALTVSTSTAVGGSSMNAHFNGSNNAFYGKSSWEFGVQGTANSGFGAYCMRGDPADPPGTGAVSIIDQSITNSGLGEACMMWGAGNFSQNSGVGFNWCFGIRHGVANYGIGVGAGNMIGDGSRNGLFGPATYQFGFGNKNIMIGDKAAGGLALFTTTTAPVLTGDSTLHVVDASIFHVGDYVSMGSAFRPLSTVTAVDAVAQTVTLSNTAFNDLLAVDPQTGTGYTIYAIPSPHSGELMIAIGQYAFLNIQGATSNGIAIGRGAGESATAADHAIVIGDLAGWNSTDLSYNILIGDNVTTSTLTATHEMNLGRAIKASGINQASGGKLGIFTDVPDLTNEFQVTGSTRTDGGRVKKTRVHTAAFSPTAQLTDNVLLINKSVAAATTVNLAASPLQGQEIEIGDAKGDASTNPITITPASGNINGAATLVIRENFGCVGLKYDTTVGWLAISLPAASLLRFTWANRPSVSAFSGLKITITDVGVSGGSEWFSNGTEWRPTAVVVLARSAVQVVHSGGTSEVVLAQTAIPASLMGLNGGIQTDALCSFTGAAGAKTLLHRLGTSAGAGTSFVNTAVTTAGVSYRVGNTIRNRNGASSQVFAPVALNGSNGQSTAAIGTGAQVTTGALVVSITGTLANAADGMALESYEVRLLP